MSTFADILKEMVDRVPGAVGAVFADWEGEAVDQFGHVPALDIKLAGAHWGVVLTLANERLQTMCGAVQEMWIEGEQSLVLVRHVTDQYFVVLTAKRGAHLATALRELDRGARVLLGEM